MTKPLCKTPPALNMSSHTVCALPHLCDACQHQDYCVSRLPTPKYMAHCLRVCQQFIVLEGAEIELLLCHKKGGAV